MMKNILRGMAALIFSAMLAVLLVACGSGGGGSSNGGDGGDNGAISGSVSGTTLLAVNDSGDIVASDDTTGKIADANGKYPFTLDGIPLRTNIRVYLITGGNIVPMYFDSNGDGTPDANVFSLTSATNIILGFVDTSTGSAAVPTNNPLSVSGVNNGGTNTDVPSTIYDLGTFIVPEKIITIDGNFDDWTSETLLYVDVDGPDCANIQGRDIQEVNISQDQEFIYIRFLLNGPLDQTFGYKFGDREGNRHLYVGENANGGYIFFGNAFGQPQPQVPNNFLAISGNQFEYKFYKSEVSGYWFGKQLDAWCDQGTNTVCQDHIALPELIINW